MMLSKTFALILSLFCLFFSLSSYAIETHTVSLEHARISNDANGNLVISMDASGDIRGMLTLTISINNGVATGGQWALVSSYVQDLNPDGSNATVVVHDESVEAGTHEEFIKLVNDGTLGGFISDLNLSANVDGVVNGINSAQLSIVSSSLNFDGASGGGWIVIQNLVDHSTLNGTLSLNF